MKPSSQHPPNREKVMEYSHRYPEYPTREVAERLDPHSDVPCHADTYTEYESTNKDPELGGSGRSSHRTVRVVTLASCALATS